MSKRRPLKKIHREALLRFVRVEGLIACIGTDLELQIGEEPFELMRRRGHAVMSRTETYRTEVSNGAGVVMPAIRVRKFHKLTRRGANVARQLMRLQARAAEAVRARWAWFVEKFPIGAPVVVGQSRDGRVDVYLREDVPAGVEIVERGTVQAIVFEEDGVPNVCVLPDSVANALGPPS